MKEYKFDFKPLVEPGANCTYSKYISWQTRKYGRRLFKIAVQEDASDLPMDPWWLD